MKEEIYPIYQSPESKALIDFEICGITYPDKNYSINRNNSRIACIEYVESGSGVITADELLFSVSNGDSYFLQPGQHQYYYADPDTPWKKYFINISGHLLSKLIEGYNLSGQIYYKNLNIKKELCRIIALAKEQSADNTQQIIGIITDIFYKMSHSLTRTKVSSSAAEKMRAFLDMKASERFSLNELCEVVSLSESQTIRLFKAAFGITPYAYFMNQKLHLAGNMLLNTNLSVKQIAHELCFADEYYFSNVFKQKEGISPRKYRQNALSHPKKE